MQSLLEAGLGRLRPKSSRNDPTSLKRAKVTPSPLSGSDTRQLEKDGIKSHARASSVRDSPRSNRWARLVVKLVPLQATALYWIEG